MMPGMGPGLGRYFPIIWVVAPLRECSGDIFSTQGFSPMQGMRFRGSLVRKERTDLKYFSFPIMFITISTHTEANNRALDK